jgi:transcriptional regulator with XRE-family HTH domain
VAGMDAQIVGERICKLRKSRGLTQQQLADELFVTNKVISKWETGLGLPDTALLPALASALGVTVDDLVADDGSMIKGEYRAECVNISENGSKTRVVKKVLIISVAVLVFVFAVYNIVWFLYINNSYKPFIDRGVWTVAGVRAQGILDYSSDRNREWIVYEYYDGENGYSIRIIRPLYLNFGGVINIYAIQVPELGDIFVEFEISFDIGINGIQQIYTIKLHEWTENFQHPLFSAVDRNGQPLERNPNDSEEYYEYWLLLYERKSDEIIEMIKYFKDFFGEELLTIP